MILTEKTAIIKDILKSTEEPALDVMHYVYTFNPLKGRNYTICDMYTLKELLYHIKKHEEYETLEMLSDNQLEFIILALHNLNNSDNKECVENTWKNIKKGLLHYPMPLM